MKSYIALLLLASLALTAQARSNNYFGGNNYGGDEKHAQILRNDQQMNNDGSYHYEYQTANGISGQEQGTGGVAVQGSSSYTSPEGVEINLSYTADETGYHPVGDHIPKTPDYVLRALEYIRTHPYQVKDYYSTRAQPKAAMQRISTAIAPPPIRPNKPRNRLSPTNNYRNNQYQNRNNQRRYGF